MKPLENTPSPVEVTPTPMAVEIPSAEPSDSGRYLAYETSPDSQRRVGRTRKSRGYIKALIVPTFIAVGVVGPETINSAYEDGRSEVKAAAAKIEAEKTPEILERIQSNATGKLFGVSQNGREMDIATAQKTIRQKGMSEVLDVRKYVKPQQLKVSEDGRFFNVENKDYGLDRAVMENGDVYIIAGRRLVETGILKDRHHIVKLILVGGAHNDASSDLNKDGVITREEVREAADLSARHNFDYAFKPPTKLRFGGATAKNEIE